MRAKGLLPERRNGALLTVSRFRLGFSLAVAVIATAIADPIVEFASNAGWFGSGSYTDHSNLDIVPALLAGVGLLALLLVRRAPAILAGQALPSGIAALLPTIFTLQVVTLYLMESAEQLIVWGHAFGPTVWLGGPPAISLAIHAAICLAVTFAIARSKRTLAATTLRVIRLITAIASFTERATAPVPVCRTRNACFKKFLPVLCTIGERAPPLAAS